MPHPFVFDARAKFKPLLENEDIDQINLKALRTGILYSEPHPAPDPLYGMQWKRPKDICSKPYFVDGKPSRFDALQGSLGDCWLVAAMGGLTLHENLFNRVVAPDQSFDVNYTGAFHFRFWLLGKWVDVVVDDRLPIFPPGSNKLVFARSRRGDIFWAALLEKAYSKVCNRLYVDYGPLAGNFSHAPFQDFTGGIIENVKPHDPPPGRPFSWFMNEIIENRALVSCSFPYDDDGYIQKKTNLVNAHAYLINKVFYTKDDDPDYHGLCLIRLMNPWGTLEWKGQWNDKDSQMWRQIDRQIRDKLEVKVENDGEFWMSETDFKQYFTYMRICHLEPGQYFQSHFGYRIKPWNTITFRGDWITGVSSGGYSRDKLHMNPQFKVFLPLPDNDADGLVRVVIEVTQRDLFKDLTDSTALLVKCNPAAFVGFHVYHLKTTNEQRQPLNQDFFLTARPSNRMVLNQIRSYVESVNLPEGWYCIVPFLMESGREGSFLLRVYAEANLEKWSYDSKISKSLPIKELPGDSVIYEEPKRIFDEAAHNGEVDWNGLKDILTKIMNSTASSVFKFLSNSLDKDHVVFSKDDCRSMIAMLDQDNSGKLNYHEFCGLWKYVHFWCGVYDRFRDSKGYLNVDKLRDALSSIGFNLNKQVFHIIVRFYVNKEGNINLTDFILCGVILETFFTRYAEDKLNEGFTLTLEEWVKITLAV